jgi:hypothetical protein
LSNRGRSKRLARQLVNKYEKPGLPRKEFWYDRANHNSSKRLARLPQVSYFNTNLELTREKGLPLCPSWRHLLTNFARVILSKRVAKSGYSAIYRLGHRRHPVAVHHAQTPCGAGAFAGLSLSYKRTAAAEPLSCIGLPRKRPPTTHPGSSFLAPQLQLFHG